MASRKLVVEIVGDSSSLDRTFKRSTKNAQSFSGAMDKSAKSMQGFSKGLVGGFAGAAAFNVLISGLKEVITLAAESQQILGQTSVAVETAGFSWQRYGKNIQSVIAAQSKLGFDDEDLLRGMSVFIRTSDTVAEAQRRTNLAMDIARARFIDYESAVNIVTKAHLGNVGALRRLGIDARKGASGVELLAQLEREYGGAAKKASNDASTAMDRFKVSVENAKEALGAKLLPALGDLLEISTDVIDGLDGIGAAFDRLNDKIATSGGLLSAVGGALQAIVPGLGPIGQAIGALQRRGRERGAPGRERERLEGVRDRPTPGEIAGRFQDPLKRKPPKGITTSQRNAWFDAKIARELNRLQDLSLAKQLARLKAIAQEVRARLAVTKDRTRQLTLEDQLLDIQRQQKSVMEGQASAAQDIVDKIKAANEALKDRAAAIKSAIIERLQRRQTDILNKRALQDAQEALRIARQIGGPKGIQAALRGLQDVQFDILRARVENAPASLTRGGTFALGGVITININGITDPEAVAKKVDEILRRRNRRTTTQTRGPAPAAA